MEIGIKMNFFCWSQRFPEILPPDFPCRLTSILLLSLLLNGCLVHVDAFTSVSGLNFSASEPYVFGGYSRESNKSMKGYYHLNV